MKRWKPARLLPAILAVSAVLPYLLDLGYRPGSIEVIVISCSAAALGIAVGWALGGSKSFNDLVVAFLVYWIIDSYFVHSLPAISIALLAGFTTLGLLQTRFVANIHAMLMAFSIFWIGSNLLVPTKELIHPSLTGSPIQAATTSSHLPPLVHIILDEQMSPEALPETIPAGDHPARRIVQDYVGRGFVTHTNVWSTDTLTTHSLGNLFSLHDNNENFVLGSGEFVFRIQSNEYLKALRDRGYEVFSVQSSYLEICQRTSGLNCFTYSQGRNGSAFATKVKSKTLRIQLALLELHSYLRGPQETGGVLAYSLIIHGMFSLGIPVEATVDILQPTAMLDVLDQVSETLEDIQPGQAYVVHILLPHFPYVLAKDCSVNHPEEWTHRGDYLVRPTAKSIYPKYWDQVACTHSKMMQLIDGLRDDAIVVVHGDHGARITKHDPMGENSADLLQTMFAVRKRGIVGKREPGRESLPELFNKVLADIIVSHTNSSSD